MSNLRAIDDALHARKRRSKKRKYTVFEEEAAEERSWSYSKGSTGDHRG
jgi:hypothetical protein